MKKIKISLIMISAMIIFAGGMFLSSCDKTEVTSSSSLEKSEEAELVANIESYESLTVSDMPQLEVRDGMLYFANSEQYFKTIAIVSKMTDEELDKWEQELGFVSLRTVQNKALDEIEILFEKQNKKQNEHFIQNNLKLILEKNSNFIEFTSDSSYRQIISSRKFSAISNKQNLFQLSDNILKTTKEYLISTNSNNKEELNLYNSNSIESLYNGILFVRYRKLVSNEKTNYGRYQGPGMNYVSKRRVFVEVWIEDAGVMYSPAQHNWTHEIHVWGEAKNWLGGWYKYKTNLTYKDGKFQTYGPRWWQGGTNYLWKYYGQKNLSGNATNKKDLYGSYLANIGHFNNTNVSMPYYTKVYVTASSRGVGDKWATINKGY